MPRNVNRKSASTTFTVQSSGPVGTSGEFQGRTVEVQEISRINAVSLMDPSPSHTTSSLSSAQIIPIALNRVEEEFNPWPQVKEKEELIEQTPPDVDLLVEELSKVHQENQELLKIIQDKNRIIQELSKKTDAVKEKVIPPPFSGLELSCPKIGNENAPWVNHSEWPNIQNLQPKLNEIQSVFDDYKCVKDKANVLRGSIRDIHLNMQALHKKNALKAKFDIYAEEFNALSARCREIPIEKTIIALRLIIKTLEIYKPGFSIMNQLICKSDSYVKGLECETSKCDANLIMIERMYDDTALMFENCVSYLNQMQNLLEPQKGWIQSKEEKEREFKTPFEYSGRRSNHIT